MYLENIQSLGRNEIIAIFLVSVLRTWHQTRVVYVSLRAKSRATDTFHSDLDDHSC